MNLFLMNLNMLKKLPGHINSNHHTFQVTNKDLYHHLEDILDYMDEPFADSSAINVFFFFQKKLGNT